MFPGKGLREHSLYAHSNSTWIAEDTPCITYGLRGVVHCNVEVRFPLAIGDLFELMRGQISSEGPDRHSGVDGGATAEPMLDLYVEAQSSLFNRH